MKHHGGLSSLPRRLALALGALAALCGLLGSACPPARPSSEQGYFMLDDDDLAARTGFLPAGWTGGPVLQGEVSCPVLLCQQQGCAERAPEDGGVAACFSHTVSGATFEGGCLSFDTPGEVVWALEPVACQPAPDAGVPLVGDRFVFATRGPDEVVPEQAPQFEAMAVALAADGGVLAEPALPADFAVPREELRIVEGGAAPVSVSLLAAEDGSAVAVEGDSLVVQDVAPSPTSVRVVSGWLLEADPGASAALRLVTNAASFEVASIEGVPLAQAASMSLYALYWTSAEAPGARAPAAVHALVRDAAGRPLDGAPVQWTLVQGDLAMAPLFGYVAGAPEEGEESLLRAPWIAVWDGCRPPSTRVGTATMHLRARLGELQQDLWLTWTLLPDLEGDEGWFNFPPTAPAGDEGFVRDQACPPGPACGCASARAGRGGAWAGAGLVAMLLIGLGGARPRALRSKPGRLANSASRVTL